MLSLLLKFRTARQELNAISEKWTRVEPRYKAALALRQTLTTNVAVLAEIEGWRGARIEWHQQLRALQSVVPSQVQLTELRVEDVLQTVSNKTLRVFRMQVRGKTGGSNAEENVSGLRALLSKHPAVGPAVEAVEIPPGSFEQDPSPSATRYDRVFTIVCRYAPKGFE
jgi:hypothetical protein